MAKITKPRKFDKDNVDSMFQDINDPAMDVDADPPWDEETVDMGGAGDSPASPEEAGEREPDAPPEAQPPQAAPPPAKPAPAATQGKASPDGKAFDEAVAGLLEALDVFVAKMAALLERDRSKEAELEDKLAKVRELLN